MRQLVLAVLLCGAPRICAALPEPPGPAPDDRALGGHSDGPATLAVFVRDRLGHSSEIASRLLSALAGERLQVEMLHGDADLQPRWTEDDARAVAAAVPYWVRVDIRRWSERREVVHIPRPGWRPATGLVIGIGDLLRTGAPEVDEGPLEPVDVGDSFLRHEVQVDVAVSIRRTGEEAPILRWTIGEGALRVDGPNETGDSEVHAWTRVYDELARRVAEKVATAIASPEAALAR